MPGPVVTGAADALERRTARRLVHGFEDYNRRFRDITRRAARHFLARDWTTSRQDAVQRIELYNRSVAAVLPDVRALLGADIHGRPRWSRIREHYAGLISDRPDAEFYKTYFSSVTRRVFDTRGVDPQENFGVTRHGRVIFYDYDEVVFVTDCNFRPLPQSDRHEDDMAAEPWYFVAANDVFPEEFIRFFGFNEDLQKLFRKYHSELLSHEWWARIKARLERGETIEVLPYTIKTRTTLLPGAGTWVTRP